jgi:hypothetical protein
MKKLLLATALASVSPHRQAFHRAATSSSPASYLNRR